MHDIKKVFLLRTIWKVCRKGNVAFIDFGKQMQTLEDKIPFYANQGIPTDKMLGIIAQYKSLKNPEEPHIRASLVLGAMAEKKFWQIWRCKEKEKERYEEYKKLLQECASETPPLVDLVDSSETMFDTGEGKYEKMVRITGLGYRFSRLDVSGARICNEYHTLSLVMIAFFGFLASINFSSAWKEFVKNIWYYLTHFIG